MNKIDKMISELCSHGVKYSKLVDLCGTITTGKLNANAMVENGEYPFYTCDSTPFRIDTYAFDEEAILISGNGSQVGHINYYKGKFNAYQRTYVLYDFKEVNVKYLLHYLSAYLRNYIMIHSKKGSIPYITLPMLQDFKVPIPPLEVQCEIVRILDNFTLLTAELTAKLTAELTARKKQYEYYKDELYNFKDKNVKYVKLKEIAEVIRGGNFQKKDFVENGKPCIHYGQIYTKYGSSANSTFTYVAEEVFNKSKQAQPNDIVMAVTSENVEDVCKCVVWCGNENIAVSGHTAIIRHNINAKYLGYYFSTSHFYKDKTKLVHGTKVMEVTPSALNEILIPLPSLEEQERIANLIENYDRLCNEIVDGLPAEIDKRQKQYEYYRDKLLSFKEVEINE